MGQNRNEQSMQKSRQIAQILAAMDRVPEIRDARVREIKRTIDAGLYRMDALKIADRILEETRCRSYRK